jgi:hypothetical protein
MEPSSRNRWQPVDHVLRHLVQPVGELTFRCGPGGLHGLVGDPAEQESLGILRLLELESGSLGTAFEVHDPAPVLERDVRGARRLHDPIERRELGQRDLSQQEGQVFGG